ncbi:hypothetical protein [Rhodococcus sp. IEGM 1381]|uniref:hypothetical protein n=1 Tax=Rhodococcus sp. IEGM 1381 TaxID=3047085 RepID=UPI0032D58A56
MGRMAEAGEVAEAAAWLLSDSTSAVTGAIVQSTVVRGLDPDCNAPLPTGHFERSIHPRALSAVLYRSISATCAIADSKRSRPPPVFNPLAEQ